MTKIQLVLVDDWELRGDGSGDMRRLQFDTLHRLLEIYERHGLRASINAEIMQQIHHLKFGPDHPGLAVLAREWEDVVTGAYRKGHDVQLHVHSQWVGARYEAGRWNLPGAWSILRHPPAVMRAIVRECKQYLERLLRTVDPGYRCVSFRSGAWCIAPSDHALGILAEEGLTFDMSVVNGLYYDNEKVQLDYRDCDEPFLPYYPVMTDARRVSPDPTPIVCIPTFSFTLAKTEKLLHSFGNAGNRICRKAGLPLVWTEPANATPVGGTTSGGAGYGVWKQSLAQRVKSYVSENPPVVSDLSRLNPRMIRLMIENIRRCADASGRAAVPVILENHTKDLGDFRPLEAFASYIASQPDIEVITLRQVHEHLAAGIYQPVRRSAYERAGTTERLASVS